MFIRASTINKNHLRILLEVQFQPLGNLGNCCKSLTVSTLLIRKLRCGKKSLVQHLRAWTEELGLKPTYEYDRIQSLCSGVLGLNPT